MPIAVQRFTRFELLPAKASTLHLVWRATGKVGIAMRNIDTKMIDL